MRTLYLILASAFVIGCKPKEVEKEVSAGTVDASSFVAIGGDRVAGYQHDALSHDGQMNSLGAILHAQLQLVGAGEYNQPLIADQSLGINLNDDSQLIMGYKTDCNNETSLSPVRYAASGNTAVWSDDLYPSSGPFNNMGVPGLSVTELYVSSNTNPYYQRFSSSMSSALADDIMLSTPTFFLADLGQDDLLKYALSGGESNPIPAVAGVNSFTSNYDQLLGDLQAANAKGVICNIPDITQFPYFTTIPYDGLELDAANANTMNQVFNPLGMTFVEGANPFTVEDTNEPFGVRKLVEGELILLSIPLDSVKCNGMGSIIPIPEEYVLTLDEIDEINQKRADYNGAISLLATTHSLALADFNSVFNSVNSTLIHNGVSYSGEFVSGGFFSLDGRNPTGKGIALLANECIRAINKQYNANIPYAKVGDYDGIKFP